VKLKLNAEKNDQEKRQCEIEDPIWGVSCHLEFWNLIRRLDNQKDESSSGCDEVHLLIGISRLRRPLLGIEILNPLLEYESICGLRSLLQTSKVQQK
jgi:hypothetical protein